MKLLKALASSSLNVIQPITLFRREKKKSSLNKTNDQQPQDSMTRKEDISPAIEMSARNKYE
jgi:hypothetical protein